MVGNLDIVLLLGSIVTTSAVAYVVYWAFAIRRALAVHLYRKQAVGIGLVAIGGEFILVFLSLALIYDLKLLLVRKFSLLFFAWGLSSVVFAFVVFYWVDASMLAARRSDPLLRDTFGWRRLRILFSSLLVVLSVAAILLPYSSFYSNFSVLGIVLGFSPYFPALIVGAMILPIAARRSKDPILHRNLTWFALFVAGVFISTLPFDLLSDIFQEVSGTYLLVLPAIYFLYRSAKALVPLNRLSLTEIV